MSISVVVPVGPQPEYKNYLGECIDSIRAQMSGDDEIIFVDDMARLSENHAFMSRWSPLSDAYIVNPWLLGCAASWNIGVARAKNDCVFLMGSDDKLLPGCLDACREAYDEYERKAAWYNVTIQIDEGPDTGTHTVFNNAAMVTKGLWRLTGGFPPSAGVGGPDALLISIMMVHMSDRLIQVKEGTPLYWCRVHEAQDTRRQAALFSWEVVQIRNKETERWQKPDWTRKEWLKVNSNYVGPQTSE